MQLQPAICVLLVACTDIRAEGRIDGERVDIVSAFFSDTLDDPGGDHFVSVVLSTMPGACALYEFYELQAEATTDPATLAEVWNSVFPPDHWEIAIAMRVRGFGPTLDGTLVQGVFGGNALDRADKVTGRFVHNTRPREAGWFAGELEDGEFFVTYRSEGGFARIRDHEPGRELRARYDTFAWEPDAVGDPDHGHLNMHFLAEPCDVATTVTADLVPLTPPTTATPR